MLIDLNCKFSISAANSASSFVFKKCWTDINKNMTDITKEIKKTNEDAESIQKQKNTRRKKARSK
jgi:hypothetical protein